MKLELHADTPAVQALCTHLLGRARDSIPPGDGSPRASAHSSDEHEVLRRFAPFAELLYLVAASDGVTHDAERAVILGAFRTLTGGRVRGARLAELEEQIRARVTSVAVDELLESVASELALSRQDAELGFTLAAAVVLADEQSAPEETAFLGRLARWLAIRPARAAELLGSA
jgi:tellurite resistance protein